MIPYNPSSFNSNKTILEQILELKNWLINHPQYEVYYCNNNASLYPFMNTFSLADVPDNTNMDVGDLVVCNNAVYCTVISIDRDNGVFTAGYGVSFKGDTGATGQQGYSLRVSSENYVDDVTAYHRNSLEPSHGTRENDTIIFANGYVGIVTSLGAGATYYVTNRTVSFVGPQGPQGPQGPTGPEGPTGATGPQGVSITNVAIDENDHLIVTLSSGSTIDAGSVSSGGSQDIVTINSSSGTLSASDLAKIQQEGCLLRRNYTSYYQYFELYFKSSTSMVFIGTSPNINTDVTFNTIEITLSTGAWTTSSNMTIKRRPTASLIDSGTATNGQVLQANGNGGATWQTPSGSGLEMIDVGNTTSGTLTSAQVDKLKTGNAIIKCNNSLYRTYYFFSPNLYLICVSYNEANKRSIINEIWVNTNTYNWGIETQSTFYANPIASIINSQTATNGQVLTANGSGGASWQTPSGTQKYMHSVRLQTSTPYSRIYFSFISDYSSPYASASAVYTAFNSNFGNNYKEASGVFVDNNISYSICAVMSTGAGLTVAYNNGTTGLTTISSGDYPFTLNIDVVTPL